MESSSHNNLKFLAYELAQNHYYNSAYDLLSPDKQKKVKTKGGRFGPALMREILGPKPNVKASKLNIGKGTRLEFKSNLPQIGKPSRNILVIGAGATYNAFQNIPLGQDAQRLILSNIKVAEVLDPDTENKEPISFEYFIEYYRAYRESKGSNVDDIQIDKNLNPDISQKSQKKLIQAAQEILKNLIRSETLLNEIADKYLSEYRKLRLLSHDREEKTFFDFENALNLLAQLLPISTLREQIQGLYNKRHAPILFYQIIAHLFKNRFIDVIINFNFDEFLDEALREELIPGTYDTVISDGDCEPLTELAAKGLLRQPLYIKPHGTASHKSTLRFTKDQYHELPMDLRTLLFEVLKGGSENAQDVDFKKKTNLITVGFDMGSIEFNEMLEQCFDKEDQIFSFFFHEDEKDKEEIKKRQSTYRSIFNGQDEEKTPTVYCIGHEFFKYSAKEIEYDGSTTLGNTFLELYKNIQNSFQKRFKPVNIDRHLLICEIFGCNEFWDLAYDMRCKSSDKLKERPNQAGMVKHWYPEHYFTSECYFKDRLILQLLIDLTLNQGMINTAMLTSGDAGKYYKLYFDTFLKNKDGRYPPSLKDILHDLDLEDKGDDLHVVKSTILSEIKNLDSQKEGLKFQEIGKTFINILLKKDLVSKELKKFLSQVRAENWQKWRRITLGFNKLYHARNTAIQSNFRSTGFHLFEKYAPSDLIITDLTFDLIFHGNLKSNLRLKNPFLLNENKANVLVDTILVVDDYGDNIAKFLKWFKIEKQKKQQKKFEIFLILQSMDDVFDSENPEKDAFDNLARADKDFEVPENRAWLEKHVRIQFRHMNDHNHHVALFMKRVKGTIQEQIKRTTDAIYYYKWGLARTIEPIHINEDKNLEYLLSRFYTTSQNEDGDVPEGWPKWT